MLTYSVQWFDPLGFAIPFESFGVITFNQKQAAAVADEEARNRGAG